MKLLLQNLPPPPSNPSTTDDRNSAVKAACGLLIKKWLQYYDNDVIKLLKALDVEGKGDLCSKFRPFLY